MKEEWAAALGVRDVQEMHGGYQSRGVYAARLDDQRVVVKLVDARHVDLIALETRVLMLARLGLADEKVCAPVAVAGRLINDLVVDATGLVYAVVYEFAPGDPPDRSDPAQVRVMGRVLGELHASLAALPPVDLPDLAAFPARSELTDLAEELGVPLERFPDTIGGGLYSPTQLLHGDFSGENVRFHNGAVRVFDFDDCGYGPVEFDVALALYMVLFGALTGRDSDSYSRFKDNFLAGYIDQSGREISPRTLDDLITYRVVVLAAWLSRPDMAPIGVRQSSDSWRATLTRFVQHYIETTF